MQLAISYLPIRDAQARLCQVAFGDEAGESHLKVTIGKAALAVRCGSENLGSLDHACKILEITTNLIMFYVGNGLALTG